MLQLGLERIRASMAEVSITEQEVAKLRKWQTREIRVGKIAVTVIYWITRGYAVTNCCAKGRITGFDLVQIDAGDQAAQSAAQVGEAYGRITEDFPFVGHVVLLNSWLLQINGDKIF